MLSKAVYRSIVVGGLAVVATGVTFAVRDNSSGPSEKYLAFEPERTSASSANERPFGVRAATKTSSPSWEIRYGHEFWRESAEPNSTRVAGETDLSDVIERTGNRFRSKLDSRFTARTYDHAVTLTDSGLKFRPHGVEPESISDPSLDWSLDRVELGGTLGHGVGEWRVQGNTAQRRVETKQGVVVEHIESRDRGVARTWILPEKPSTLSDFRVRTTVSGLTHLETTASGEHYADDDGVARVRVSPPVFVDASGTRTPLQVRRTPGALEYVVPAAVLARADYPAALDPVLTAEVGVDESIPAVGGEQREPDLSATTTGFVVTWEDTRSSTQVYVARLNSNLGVLDPNGLVVGPG
ncbi:MAG: hypothetical protein AAFY60_05585, partial [Myxococcota bacterium]